MAFVGRGEAKAQVEFSACGKWNIVPCASTKSWGWEKNGATNRNFCDIIRSSKKVKSGNLLRGIGFSLFLFQI
jgi:hypothetical protein